MTKTQMKVVLGSIQDIPLDRLVLSQSNVRRVKAGVSIEELAEDIARRGLLSALAVRPLFDEAGAATDRFEVPAGGRRFQALQRLVKAKRLAKSAPVPCIVKDSASGISAEDDSLAENVHRVALHPLDQFRAFKTLADQGQSEEDIAAAWFVTPAVVRQRLRLAAVSPVLLEQYAEDALTLEQVIAFTVTTDHARQEEVFERLQSSWNKDAYYIRNLLTQGTVSERDRRVRYVGLAAYQAAGGVILRDLFTEDGDGWLEDALLLDRLALDKLQDAAVPVIAEGWHWCDVALDFPYGHHNGLRRLQPVGSGLSADEQAQREALQAEYEQLEAEYADQPGDLPEEVDRRLGEIEAEFDRLDAIPDLFDDADRARAGVFVSLGGDGTVRIDRGFVRAEDEDHAPAADGDQTGDADDHGGSQPPESVDSDAQEDEDGQKPLPERLLGELTAHRTIALRHAVGEVPDVALTLLLHKLVRDLFGSGIGSAGCLDVSVRPAYLSVQAADLNESEPARAVAARHAGWVEILPVDDDVALWRLLATMSDFERASLLAHCIGCAVNARWEKGDRTGAGVSARGVSHRIAEADRLAQAVALDVAATGWRPTVTNYLGQVTKPQILAAVGDGVSTMAAQMIDHLKKPDMAREAERLLADTDWVPQPLRTPAAPSSETRDNDNARDGEDSDPLPLAAE